MCRKEHQCDGWVSFSERAPRLAGHSAGTGVGDDGACRYGSGVVPPHIRLVGSMFSYIRVARHVERDARAARGTEAS